MMKYKGLVIAVALASSGCAPVDDRPPNGFPGPIEGGICEASEVQSLVGRSADPGTLERARQLSGAAILRTIPPGQMVTQEFNGTRLTIDTDQESRIVAVRCG